VSSGSSVFDRALDEAHESCFAVFELCEYGQVMQLAFGEAVRPFSEDLARKYFRDIVLGLEYRELCFDSF